MIYGIFSDVHGNLEALEATLAFFAQEGAEGYICCGDIVGYGPDPNACLDRVRGLKNLSLVSGNHDLAVVGRLEMEWFNPYARTAAIWTRAHLKPDHAAFLNDLPARLETPKFTIAHGSPRRPVDEYLLSAAQFRDNLDYVRIWPLFVGHSHMPLHFSRGDDARIKFIFLEEGQIIDTSGVTAFNPGSTGQPRDQDSRTCCALYDDVAHTFRVCRVPYDVAVVQEKIRQVGLPEYLALRLAYGQ